MEPIKRTALITGATRGIGRAIALRLATEGYRIILNYAGNETDARETLAVCRGLTSDVVLVKADVSRPHDVERLMNAATESFGSLDVLINNAGLNIDKPFLELTQSDWDTVVGTNMTGVFLCSQAAARLMLQQEQGGTILMLGATTAIRGRRNGANYCASKAGVLAMTKCLALELAPKVRVNCVIPGLVSSEEARHRFRLDEPAERRKREAEIPLGYIGDVQDIADAVTFLISPAARYINGQKLIIDGGQYMY